ncbi:unnamed protein product [Schistocephalus solidus]|uniref:Uncharacterized protein n=1 Tax=Schistocephalus solidus TaxID=70667 RepID=A0A3P7CYT9_SCHSO|nr:unnamed protein product [Schistocephalus solidus]
MEKIKLNYALLKNRLDEEHLSKLDMMNKLRRPVWTRKFIALSSTKGLKTLFQDGSNTLSYAHAIEKVQKKSSVNQGLSLWYQELIEDIQDFRDDAEISPVLKRLENLAHLPVSKFRIGKLITLISCLSYWEICSPFLAAALDFIHSRVIALPTDILPT